MSCKGTCVSAQAWSRFISLCCLYFQRQSSRWFLVPCILWCNLRSFYTKGDLTKLSLLNLSSCHLKQLQMKDVCFPSCPEWYISFFLYDDGNDVVYPSCWRIFFTTLWVLSFTKYRYFADASGLFSVRPAWLPMPAHARLCIFALCCLSCSPVTLCFVLIQKYFINPPFYLPIVSPLSTILLFCYWI